MISHSEILKKFTMRQKAANVSGFALQAYW